ncbi:MAG TPA: FeoA family protein [Lacipirellulaceae bacterium]|nr:FeoA family protein [Lacipirellulaceae bacterium]
MTVGRGTDELSLRPQAVRLADLHAQTRAEVAVVAVPAEDAVRLKSLGICVGRRVQLVQGGDPLIVRVLGARVGISARLAEAVLVAPDRSPLAPATEPGP